MTTQTTTPPPRLRSFRLCFGLLLIALGLTAFIVDVFDGSAGPVFTSIVFLEALLVLWLIRRQRRLEAARNAQLHALPDGPDPVLVQEALLELEETDRTTRFEPMLETDPAELSGE